MIYSHGNSSDLADAIRFLELLGKKNNERVAFNLVSYDFSGYGESEVRETTEESMVRDLQMVIKWLKVPHSSIVLWGFSLGTYPTVQVAAKLKIGGVILHCPLASGACFLDGSE